MAKEIKTLTVKPNEDAQTIQNLQCFGWTLLSSQEVYNKDSHLEAWGKNTYSVTQTTHYVKLIFEWDTSKIINYSQIRRLEEAYMAVSSPKRGLLQPTRKENLKLVVPLASVILCAPILFLTALFGAFGEGLFICAFIVGMFYLMFKWNNRMAEKYEVAVSRCWKKRNEIAQQAEKYL